MSYENRPSASAAARRSGMNKTLSMVSVLLMYMESGDILGWIAACASVSHGGGKDTLDWILQVQVCPVFTASEHADQIPGSLQLKIKTDISFY